MAFACQVGFVLANTLMAHYARWIDFLGGNVRDVGWIMGFGATLGLLLRPWQGLLINRLGARTTWGLGFAIFALGTVFSLTLEDLGWAIYLCRSSHVLGAAIVFSSSVTYASQRYPVSRRAEAIGILGAGGFVGMLVGPALGDVILGAEGRVRTDFVWLFAVALGALVVPSLCLAFLPASPRHRVAGATRLREFVRSVARHWPGMILLVSFFFGAYLSVPFAFLADYIDAAGLAFEGFNGLALFFLGYGGWGLVVRVALRRVPDRIGRRRVLLLGLLAMALGLFSFLLVRPEAPGLLIVPGLICGTGHALGFHTMTTLALERFPLEVHGTGAALTFMTVDLGLMAGAPALGLVADLFGYDTLFASMGIAALSVAALYALASLRAAPR